LTIEILAINKKRFIPKSTRKAVKSVPEILNEKKVSGRLKINKNIRLIINPIFFLDKIQ